MAKGGKEKLGIYLNPGNAGFAEMVKSDYVDKTELIGLLNRTIGTEQKLTCISRPRRFGKTFAAKMLCAYYDNSCDSHWLFEQYRIASDETYQEHLNRYYVICLDITGFISSAKVKNRSLADIPDAIEKAILEDVQEMVPDLNRQDDLKQCLLELVRRTGTQLIFVIDEWDSVFREAREDEQAQERYLNLLRSWFENNSFTHEAVAAAYMTGILPIRKVGSRSAISDFQEYSMLEPRACAKYVGFTEEEVRELCVLHAMDFTRMKKWYGGYHVGTCHSIYNPYYVMQAIARGKTKPYWKMTSAPDNLMTFIDMNQEGLQEDIVRLIAGERILVDTDTFQNDLETFTSKDDVLTLLIHLGYLTCMEEDGNINAAWIPNAEIRDEFDRIPRRTRHSHLIKLVRKSDQLLEDTVAGNGDAVAKVIQAVRETEDTPTGYTNEQSLCVAMKKAYISAVGQYAKIEELPAGHGIADVVFLPKKYSRLPAIIVELKRDKTAEGAIRQIREKHYPKVIEKYEGEILLAGISVDETTGQYTCVIEKRCKASGTSGQDP